MSEEQETAEPNIDDVSGDEFLLRRIPHNTETAIYIKEDGSVSSLSFQPSPKDAENGLSVNIKSKSSFEKTVLDKERYSVIQIQVENVTSIGELEVKADPCPPEDTENDAHALILGLDRTRKSKKIQRKLAKLATELKAEDT